MPPPPAPSPAVQDLIWDISHLVKDISRSSGGTPDKVIDHIVDDIVVDIIGIIHDGGNPPVSDVRLKEDIVSLDRLANGLGLYRFRYKWSDQQYVGVMAQEVQAIVPDAVIMGSDGYLRVDYGRLGLNLMKWDEWLAKRQAQ